MCRQTHAHTCIHNRLTYTYGQRDSNPDLTAPPDSHSAQNAGPASGSAGESLTFRLLKTKAFPQITGSPVPNQRHFVSFCPQGLSETSIHKNRSCPEGHPLPLSGTQPDPGEHRQCPLKASLGFSVPSVSRYYMLSYPELDFIPTCIILIILQYF